MDPVTTTTTPPTTSPTPGPTPGSTTGPTTGPTTGGGSIPTPSSSDFEMYLKMLTAQVRNQDPLDPMDSDDYALQLATFAGVEQQVLTNEHLAALSGQMAISSLGQMAAWVGQEARAAMPVEFDGSPVTVSPNPPVVADHVELVVRNAAGTEVGRSRIPVSAEPIDWAGVGADGAPLPPGRYSFEVVSSAGGEVILTEPAEVYARVTEVRSVGGETVLVTAGGVMVPAASVTALRSGG
jgi:flagellar basal-body rod modification protein FlgD